MKQILTLVYFIQSTKTRKNQLYFLAFPFISHLGKMCEISISQEVGDWKILLRFKLSSLSSSFIFWVLFKKKLWGLETLFIILLIFSVFSFCWYFVSRSNLCFSWRMNETINLSFIGEFASWRLRELLSILKFAHLIHVDHFKKSFQYSEMLLRYRARTFRKKVFSFKGKHLI